MLLGAVLGVAGSIQYRPCGRWRVPEPASLADGSSAGNEGRELLGGRPAYLVADRLAAGDGQAGRGGSFRVDGGELLGGGLTYLVADRLVAGDG